MLSDMALPENSRPSISCVRTVSLSDNLNAKIKQLENGAFYFEEIVTKSGNRLLSGLNVHDLIETMSEFINRQLHDSERYGVIEEGSGFNACLVSNRGVPELQIDVIKDRKVVESFCCRRFEMRVVIKKIQALLAQTGLLL